eukprot:CAMPEP_0171322808 /NCGR_PEP_ID=MMETSP0816-20121228/115191_1 /TAXON_ID=420281 /ORGANISM="Proboscia inermis, Strain CCAP1064/1" /LENGTH=76 /DNA_ID=CAMNT_0011821377 /DNA_START=2066 /DNA_END=2296 /DNA_ORIENTATION=+
MGVSEHQIRNDACGRFGLGEGVIADVFVLLVGRSDFGADSGDFSEEDFRGELEGGDAVLEYLGGGVQGRIGDIDGG